MTRIVLIVILICVALGACFYQATFLTNGHELRGIVWFAKREIPKGAKFSHLDVQRRDIEASKIPQDAVVDPSIWIGRKIQYGVSKGQIVSAWDFEPPTRNLVRAVNRIEEGQVIKRPDIDGIKLNDDPRILRYFGAVKNPESIVGKRATSSIEAGQYLYKRQFE